MDYPHALNEKETAVFEAFLVCSNGGKVYASHEDVQARLGHTVTKRQFSGYCSSLERKGWLFAMGDPSFRDSEITCMALRASGVLIPKAKRYCNHPECFCHT